MLARSRESLADLADIEEVINGPIRITLNIAAPYFETRDDRPTHANRRSAPNIEMRSHNLGSPQHRKLQAKFQC